MDSYLQEIRAADWKASQRPVHLSCMEKLFKLSKILSFQCNFNFELI